MSRIAAILVLSIVIATAQQQLIQSAAAQQQVQRDRSATDARIVAAGKDLFRRNCAICHGWNAEGIVEDWRQPDAEGRYPPPPLNGTAHTWHHTKSVLTRTIKQGTGRLGGNMPPFQGKMSDTQISAVIDYLVSLWPEDVYQAWLKRGGYR